jgi:hypothetical protein
MINIKAEIDEYFESKMVLLNIDISDGTAMGYSNATKVHRLVEIKKSIELSVDEVEKICNR